MSPIRFLRHYPATPIGVENVVARSVTGGVGLAASTTGYHLRPFPGSILARDAEHAGRVFL